jgi:hypothetical protein
VGEGHHAAVRTTLGDIMLQHNLNAGAGSASARSSLERGAKQTNEGRKAPPNGYARILRHGEYRQGAQQAGVNGDRVEPYRSAWTSRSSKRWQRVVPIGTLQGVLEQHGHCRN